MRVIKACWPWMALKKPLMVRNSLNHLVQPFPNSPTLHNFSESEKFRQRQHQRKGGNCLGMAMDVLNFLIHSMNRTESLKFPWVQEAASVGQQLSLNWSLILFYRELDLNYNGVEGSNSSISGDAGYLWGLVFIVLLFYSRLSLGIISLTCFC